MIPAVSSVFSVLIFGVYMVTFIFTPHITGYTHLCKLLEVKMIRLFLHLLFVVTICISTSVTWSEPETPETKRCPDCGQMYTEDIKFCGKDGTELLAVEAELICPKCGQRGELGETFCRNDGAELEPAPAMLQLINEMESKAFSTIPIAGPSWVPEIATQHKAHYVLDGDEITINPGVSTTGIDKDGSDEMIAAFCQACITGEKAKNIVEECYCSTILCLLGNQAIEAQRKVEFPEQYKIPYMKF